MFTDDEKGTLIVEGREKLAGAEVAIGYHRSPAWAVRKTLLNNERSWAWPSSQGTTSVTKR